MMVDDILYGRKYISRKEMMSHLNDYLINWKYRQGKDSRDWRYSDEGTFHIKYNDGTTKYIHDQDYHGEKIKKSGIVSIEYWDSCSHLYWEKRGR